MVCLLQDAMNSSYPPLEHSHRPSLDHKLLLSTWHVLEQSPPPSLREILSAYRSKGDGDRDMLIAMLNAKSAEDQRIAAIASLHRSFLDLYTTDANIPPSPPIHQYPLSSPHINNSSNSKDKRHTTERHESVHKSVPSSREPPHQPQPPRKRQRYSRSPPPSSHRDARSSHPSSRDLPPSPYSSSRSDSEEYSPRSRAPMAIGSLLSSSIVRDPVLDDPQNSPELPQARFPSSAIGVSV